MVTSFPMKSKGDLGDGIFNFSILDQAAYLHAIIAVDDEKRALYAERTRGPNAERRDQADVGIIPHTP